MDFTVSQYQQLLESLIARGYHFQTFEDFIKKPQNKVIILRHDVDALPHNSLVFAKLQNKHGVKGVYYFRAVPQSWDEQIIKEIASLGHEVGYHYENLTTWKGDVGAAIKDFKQNLDELRKLVPVSTICMHGSPMSRFDSKDLWSHYNYKDFGIIAEPYFDVDFGEVFYLTDTGRRWDGSRVSVRDKVKTSQIMLFHSTSDIIRAAKDGRLPDKIMFTFHPQRWTNNWALWLKELIFQNFKNLVKKYIFVKNDH